MPNKNLVIAVSVVGLCALVGIGIFLFDSQKNNNDNSTSATVSSSSQTKSTTQDKTFSNDELAKNNGISGNKCYVAVDGKVYDLSNFSLWRNGVHSPSGGQASCGKELSQVMAKAPHGKSKLSIMPQVGTLAN